MQTGKQQTAVILMNLGTPEQPTPGAVGKFLREFLSDPRVVEAPRWFWLPLLRFVVVPLRCKRVARLYRAIWTDSGSPIRAITAKQTNALQCSLNELAADNAPKVMHAMTYGKPALAEVVQQLTEQGCQRILLLPLYPQYSGSTTGAIYDQLADIYRQSRNVPDIRVVKHYYQHPLYIEALAASVENHWAKHGRSERLLMSFHGVPQEYVDAGDPYYVHCQDTAQALAHRLQLNNSSDVQWAFSFQSRFGPRKWLQPYTDQLLEEWVADGVKSVDVISPAFAADCLETLEELAQENCQLFLEKGGSKYYFIPCLNDSNEHIFMLSQIVSEQLKI